MLIVISDDYSRFTVDKRMSEKLCHQVLTDLERRYKVGIYTRLSKEDGNEDEDDKEEKYCI